MEFSFTAISKITLRYTPEMGQSSDLLKTDLRLEISKNMPKDHYLKGDLPTKAGIKPLTQALLQGLTANIKMCHEKGWWNEVEHIKYIIDYLQQGFVNDSKVTESTM